MATNSSKRPRTIAKIKMYFSKLSKPPKFPAGPMVSPKPGPTLAKAVVAPDNAVIKSNPHKERLRVKITKKAKKQHIIVIADR